MYSDLVLILILIKKLLLMHTDPFTLKNKLIVITGASSGIGRMCAIACSKMGATVVLFGRNIEKLKETKKFLVASNNHPFYAVDLQEYDDVSKAVYDIVGNKGKIEGIVNCAGISTTLPFRSLSPQKMDFYFNTNVIASLNLTKCFVKSSNFSPNGGSVIFISSVMGVVGESGKVLYSMTKGALIAATRSLALELAYRKIRVNTISPGVVSTPMSKNAIYNRDEKSYDKIKSLHPLGIGKPEDVANAVVFLLSDASTWITGTNLVVDGGYLSR